MLLIVGVGLVSCSNLDESTTLKTVADNVIYSETFASTIGKFTTKSVIGNQVWTHNTNGYIGMTGYVSSSKLNYANEDWLISPEIALTNDTAFNLSFDYVAHLMGNVSTECTVWVSENYVADSLPTAAKWTQLSLDLISDPGNYVFTSTGEISLNAFSGKNIRIAIKYISSDTKAGTLELKNFLVKRGRATVKIGNDGTEESPYTVAESMLHQTGVNAWVKGYIVGYVWSGTQTNYIFGADTCTQATNILIADTNSVTNLYIAKSLPIQLVAGVVRTGLNLPANKSLIGKKVTLYGALSSYFSVPGLKTVSYFKYDDKINNKDTTITGGTKPIKAIFSETFASSSQGSFTVQNVVLPTVLTYIWSPTATYGMKASAYKSANYASESWLISPAIDFTKITAAKLMFEQALNFTSGNPAANFVTVWVSTDYTAGLPGTANWTQVTVPTYPVGSNYTFVGSGDILLNAFAGKSNVRIAFKYVSTAAIATTWEVKNIVVY